MILTWHWKRGRENTAFIDSNVDTNRSIEVLKAIAYHLPASTLSIPSIVDCMHWWRLVVILPRGSILLFPPFLLRDPAISMSVCSLNECLWLVRIAKDHHV